MASRNTDEITCTHPQYDKWLPSWKRCRDVVAGQDAVKAAANEYLPVLTGMENDEYANYLRRATFFNATKRTVAGLVGFVMRKPHKLTGVDDNFEQDNLMEVGADGLTLRQLEKYALSEILITGRVGILTDAPLEDGTQPYVTLYRAEDVTNWRLGYREGRERLVMVTLKETYEREDGEFGTKLSTRYREFRLVGIGDAALCQARTWKKVLNRYGVETDKWISDEWTILRVKGGKGLKQIPFGFITPDGVEACISEPPILDLVDLNLSHYLRSADLEWGRHFTALPTAWVAGFSQEETNNLRIGSSRAWTSQDVQAKCGFLEFSGAGLGHLADAQKSTEAQMAVIGSRLLEQKGDREEFGVAVRLRQAGEHSVIADLAQAVSSGLTVAIRWWADWKKVNLPEEFKMQLNTDFDLYPIDPQMMSSLMIALQSGQISYSTWFYNLQRGEILPDGRTEEEERDLIEAGLPTAPPAPEDPNADPEVDPNADPKKDDQKKKDPAKGRGAGGDNAV